MSGVLDRFADDERILMWDVYNEPGNEGFNGNAPPPCSTLRCAGLDRSVSLNR